MKKFILIAAIALAVSAALSAQSQSYTVQSITGTVERDAGNGKWVALRVGETLKADTVIRTVIGTSLKVKIGEEIITIGPMKNGKLSEIASGGGSIQISGKVSVTDTSDASRTSGRVSTASARASDAAGDIEIEE